MEAGDDGEVEGARIDDDEAFARRLAAELEAEGSAERRRQMAEDEALARALVDEEKSLEVARSLQRQTDATLPSLETVPSTTGFFSKSSADELSLDEMKSLVALAGMRHNDCIERRELVERAREAWRVVVEQQAQTAMMMARAQQSAASARRGVSRRWEPPVLSTVGSASELLEAAEAAQRGRVLESGLASEPFRATAPHRVDDVELEALRPLYTELLTTSYERVMELIETQHPEAAWVLLAILDYPFSVFAARKFHHADKDAAPQLMERAHGGFFVLSVVVNRVAKDKRLIRWCREALGGRRHDRVVEYCLRHLVSATSGAHKPTKTVRRHVLGRPAESDDFEGDVDPMRALVADLAAVFRERRLSSNVELLALQLPVACVAALDADRVGRFNFFFQTAPDVAPAFLDALDRVKPTVESGYYDLLSASLFASSGDDDAANDDHKAADRADDAWNPANRDPARRCDRQGCNEIGWKKCARCRLTSYCSKECQTADWKERHKLVCRKPCCKNKKKNTAESVSA